MKATGNREIDDLQRKQQELAGNMGSIYAALGRAYFEKNGSNPDPAFANFCTQIKDINNQQKQIETRIKFLNGIVVCSNCGLDNGVASSFCAGCGARLPHKMVTDDANRCKNCGNLINPGQRFCGTCGAPVGSAPAATPATPTQPVEAVPVEVAPVEAVSAPVEVVPVEVPVEVAPVETPVEVAPVAAVKKCPNCGAEITEDDSIFCAECGTKLV